MSGEKTGPEITLAPVIELHEQWVKAGAPPLGVPLARWWDVRLVELHNAIQASIGADNRKGD